MNSFDTLAKNHTDLNDEALEHVQRLISEWGVLSDLCFADLLLFAPVAKSDGSRFVVLGQARPTTSQTFHLDVLVGRIVDEFERPMVARAWRRGEIVESEDVILGRGERARVQCIPVRYAGETIAILSRESPLQVSRRPGQLERVYLETFQRFAHMVATGRFPYAGQDSSDKASPRIGDGSLVLDADRRITFASPNAMNAMHRMGFLTNVIGSRLEEIGIPGTLVKTAYETARPIDDELEPRLNVTLSIAALPLINDEDIADGALVMVRDVTDLRRLDRLLHSKDATIREIHHRVKNNLQTISSLLDLQSRRLDTGPARTALEEAHRRVRSIALVHEILSRDANEQVAFNEIIEPLVRVAAQTALVADHHVEFDVVGDAGELEAAIATPLAVVLAEILANAVEHAFPDGKTADGERPHVSVSLENDGRNLNLRVSDNGVGLPEGFNIRRTKSLGLSITHSLVTSQLQGTMEMTSDNGTVVELCIPLRTPR
jgi:two-component system, sensor histidine kinase PdtaS